jgi:hypothetical protein
VVIFIQEFKKMRHIKEAEVFTELKQMGATNIAKYIDRTVGNKKIWILDIYEVDESSIDATDFKAVKDALPWEE